MRKDNTDSVVEHKGFAGRAGAIFALARIGLRHLRCRSKLGPRPAIAGRLLGGRNGE
jgi:hypothetical protein